MLKPFQLHGPSTLKKTTRLLTELGEEGAVYCGGTELIQVMKAGFLQYQHLVDIKGIEELKGIRLEQDPETLIIGSTVTHREIELSSLIAERLPVLVQMERMVANVRVRSRGTLGGNLCFAEPHSDPATLLLALDASLLVSSESGQRVIPMADFILDAFTTALESGEVLNEVRVPLLERRVSDYQKFGIYERPTIGVAVALLHDGAGSVQESRIAVGCVDPKPTRIPEAEALLSEVAVSEFEVKLEEAAQAAAAAVDPIEDLHGSEEYKRHLVAHFVRRAASQARSQMEA